jgi:hypothetical protein
VSSNKSLNPDNNGKYNNKKLSWFERATQSRRKPKAAAKKTSKPVDVPVIATEQAKIFGNVINEPKLDSLAPVERSRTVRFTLQGRGSTKQIADSNGGIYDSVKQLCAAYGCSPHTVYQAISTNKGVVSKKLRVWYTGKLVPRWYYVSQDTTTVYPHIHAAAKGENTSQGRIARNLRSRKNNVRWSVVAEKEYA